MTDRTAARLLGVDRDTNHCHSLKMWHHLTHTTGGESALDSARSRTRAHHPGCDLPADTLSSTPSPSSLLLCSQGESRALQLLGCSAHRKHVLRAPRCLPINAMVDSFHVKFGTPHFEMHFWPFFFPPPGLSKKTILSRSCHNTEHSLTKIISDVRLNSGKDEVSVLVLFTLVAAFGITAQGTCSLDWNLNDFSLEF